MEASQLLWPGDIRYASKYKYIFVGREPPGLCAESAESNQKKSKPMRENWKQWISTG